VSGAELPEGWAASGIDQLCHRITDGTHFSPKEQNRRSGYKYVTAKNIREWGLDLSDVTYVSEAIHRPIFQRCNPEKDDVLYIKDGATAGIAILNPLEEEFSLLSSVALLKPDRSQLDPSFLKWYLMSPAGRRAMLDQVTGSAITRLTLEIIRKSEIPTPPLPEQKRIVARVEELLSSVNAARDRLARVPAILKRFRQAVLAAACEGRLTREYRPEETAEDAVPPAWRLATLEELSERITKGTTPTSYGHSYQATGIPFVRVENLKGGRIDRKSVRHCISEDTHRSQSRSMLQQGDILFSIAGTIGETALVAADDVPANTN
jgi:type I restriction enzyme S subunit